MSILSTLSFTRFLVLDSKADMGVIDRDPWWVITTISLFYTIKREYNFGIRELVTISPRFGIMLASMCLSLAFVVVDECSVLGVFNSASLPSGVQPFWKVCA